MLKEFIRQLQELEKTYGDLPVFNEKGNPIAPAILYSDRPCAVSCRDLTTFRGPMWKEFKVLLELHEKSRSKDGRSYSKS